MKRLASWLGWTGLTLALLYGFFVLGYAIWLRRVLAPGNLAASSGCWGPYDSMAKAGRTRASRDALVLYVLRESPAAPQWRAPGANLWIVPAEYVYWTWWPVDERDRLFASVASRLRRCGQSPPGWPWNKA